MMTVSGFTLVSRILGFLRDILIARFVGTGPVADAFVAAFRFPNMFRRIFGEGAYNAAFVPMFGRKVEQDGQDEAVRFARNTFSSLLWVLGILTVVAIPCMPWIMTVVVPGFLPKFDEELKRVGAGQAFYETTVNMRGAREVYIQLTARDGVSVQPWRDRIVLEEMRFEGHDGDGGTPFWTGGEFESSGFVTRQVSLSGDSESGVGREVAGADFRLRPGERVIGAVHELDEGGVARIGLPADHRFEVFRARVMIDRAAGSAAVTPATLRVYRSHPKTFDLTVALSRVMFCYLLFMALAAHLSGVLNTYKRFAMPAAAPILLNIVLLGALTLIWVMRYEGDLEIGLALAWGVAIAGFLQFAALWVACANAKAAMVVGRPRWNADLKKLLFLMGPGVVAAGIQQVNLLVGGIIASFQQGAIAFLYYSDRVYQLPLGMIGIALGVVLLPEVTRRLRSGREREAAHSILRGMELAMLLTVPAAVAMVVIHQPLISVLFERGKFGSDDVLKTGWALAGFALGLPGYVLIKVLQPAYFAREDTKSPMYMAGIAVAVNILCSVILFKILRPTGYGHVGIAVATAISAWVNVVLLWRGMDGFVTIPTRERRKLGRILLASAGMGAVVWVGSLALAPWLGAGPVLKVVALALLVGLGGSIYGLLALLLRATSLTELRESFRK